MLTVAADDAPGSSWKGKLSNMGEITVELARCITRSTVPYYESASPTDSFELVAEHGIPEKALKGRAISTHAR